MSLVENGGGQNKDQRKIFNFFANLGEKIVRATLGPGDEELQAIVADANPTELSVFLAKSRDLKLRLMATHELARRLNGETEHNPSNEPPSKRES